MKKAVAISYVIALILGVAVIGILGYWFVSQSGKTVGEGTKVECNSKLFLYCNTLKDGNPNTNLWDPKCNDILGIKTPFPALTDCK